MTQNRTYRSHWCTAIDKEKDLVNCKHCSGLTCRYRRCLDYCDCRAKKKEEDRKEITSLWEELEKLDE